MHPVRRVPGLYGIAAGHQRRGLPHFHVAPGVLLAGLHGLFGLQTQPIRALATLTAVSWNSDHSLAPPQPSIRRRTATRPSQSPEGASPLFFIFLMALGGLGAILLSAHPSLSPSHVLSQVDLRSVFLAVVFLIIVLVLGAYLLLRILSCGSSRCLGCRWFPLVSLPCPHAFAGSD